MLLDSHVVLWLVGEHGRIGPRCRRAIVESAMVHVSAVTHAEFAVKAAIGKVDLPEDLPALLETQGLQPMPFTATHATAMATFQELVRHDPFDRMLLAQASVEHVTLATADRRLLALDLPWVLDARS
ncbi:type II toxin-antitoxin system VapC family toxin [Pseudactinotalea sp.]|uniref:type II toxin-antitoxin system VapC family toxin n=1 Tax=Pseudactinotalea sp. TaxID=1926260 RepID=UPI003B3AFFCA